MKKKINVLSLFDGISCGRVALERSGIEVGYYYASEINPYSIKVSKSNYPDIIQLGDIRNWENWDIKWDEIDLLIGGSPCQGFSNLGKKLNFDDSRSELFFFYVDILEYLQKINPSIKFLLENVRMKKEWCDIISEYLGVQPVLINSSLVSAQSRQRNYWCNWNVSLPEDKNIKLKDILETDGIPCCLNRDRKTKKTLVHNISCHKSPALLKRDARGVSSFLHSSAGVVEKDGIPRMLTPIERERLQTLPDNYTSSVSKTRRFETTGDCWTVDVIVHLLNCLKHG